MKKYRIITNGNRHKAQIKDCDIWTLFIPQWRTLKRCVSSRKRLMFIDIIFDTYMEAEQAAIKNTAPKPKKIIKKWKVAHQGSNFYKNVGLPEPDPDLSDTM